MEAGRTPDFAVTYRTHTPFHVEVTRLSPSQLEQQRPLPIEPELQYDAHRRLTDLVCDKLGQLASTTPNVLWVWSDSPSVLQLEVGEVMAELKRRAEGRDEELFARHGFGKPADFVRVYQRLSAILIQKIEGTTAPTVQWWQNKDARLPLPPKVAMRLPQLAATANA
jgi:hypothetical protein